MATDRSALFHGARMQVPDTHIRPPAVTGASAHASGAFRTDKGESHANLAFATPHEHVAWNYASNTDHLNTPLGDGDHPMNNDPDPKYRSRVYTVAPAHDQVHDGTEVASRAGFKITGEIHTREGQTGTFQDVNWNAYKAKKMTFGHHTTGAFDANHQAEPDLHPRPARPEPVEDHPHQLNLFSGKTRTEQERFERTPGLMVSRQFSETDVAAHLRDTASRQARRRQPYHWADAELGTVL